MGIFCQNLVRQYGFEVPVRVYSDSSAGIAIAGRQGCGPVRHLEVKQLWVQQHVASGRVCLLKIRGVDNPADIGTKIRPADRLIQLTRNLGFMARVPRMERPAAAGGRPQ